MEDVSQVPGDGAVKSVQKACGVESPVCFLDLEIVNEVTEIKFALHSSYS